MVICKDFKNIWFFPSNNVYNTGHFIDFSPKKLIFSSKRACISSTILTFCPIIHCVFTPRIPKRLFFPQIATIIQGTLLTFLQKKVILPQNTPAYRARFWLFCLIIHCVFTPIISKKFIFPQIMIIIQGTLLTFLPKKEIFSSKCACISNTILTFLPNNPVCFDTKNS